MTCKDCIKNDVCEWYVHLHNEQDVEKRCKHIKVQVKCEKCKHRKETPHGSYCLPVFGLKRITDLNAYCSYGERKYGKDTNVLSE